MCGRITELVAHARLCHDCQNKKLSEWYEMRKAASTIEGGQEESKKLVYFVRDPEEGSIKIGYTKVPIERRLQQLQTGNPRELTLLACVPGTTLDESRLHARFACDLERGEWFRPSPELLAYIDSLPVKPQAAAA
jgi:hypothetical protein